MIRQARTDFSCDNPPSTLSTSSQTVSRTLPGQTVNKPVLPYRLLRAVRTEGGKAKKKLDLLPGRGSESDAQGIPTSSTGAGSDNKKGTGKPFAAVSDRTLRRDAEALKATIEQFMDNDYDRCIHALKSVIDKKGE